MALEAKMDEKGNRIVFDEERNIQLQEIAGRPGEGYAYDFTYKEKKIRILIGNEDIHLWEVLPIKEFPEEFEEERLKIISLIKECFDFHLEQKSKVTRTQYQAIYSLS